jgi:hypothetical protein
MKLPVRLALLDINGNNDAHSTRPNSTYKSGNLVQTTGATSDIHYDVPERTIAH